MGQCLLNRLARRVHRSDPDSLYHFHLISNTTYISGEIAQTSDPILVNKANNELDPHLVALFQLFVSTDWDFYCHLLSALTKNITNDILWNLEVLGTNVWSLLFPPRGSWTRLSNWGGLHLLPARRIFACCKYQRSPYCQYLLNHHHQDYISYLDYFALSLRGFLCQLISLVSSKIPESSSSPVR